MSISSLARAGMKMTGGSPDSRPCPARGRRREDEVNRTLRVAIRDVDLVAREGRDEDDRRHLRLLPLPDQRGSLEPVHAGHPYVEQDDGKVLDEALAQCGA